MSWNNSLKLPQDIYTDSPSHSSASIVTLITNDKANNKPLIYLQLIHHLVNLVRKQPSLPHFLKYKYGHQQRKWKKEKEKKKTLSTKRDLSFSYKKERLATRDSSTLVRRKLKESTHTSTSTTAWRIGSNQNMSWQVTVDKSYWAEEFLPCLAITSDI